MSDKIIVVDGIKVSDDNTKWGTTKFLRLMRDLQGGSVLAVFDIFEYLFGPGKFEEVEAHFADPETGETKIQDVINWFNEVGEKVAKN